MSAVDHGDPPRGFDPGLWRTIWSHAAPYRATLLLLAGAGVVVAGIESLLPMITRFIVDNAIGGADGSRHVRYCLIYGAFFTVFSALIYVFIVSAGKAATGIAHDLRRSTFGKLQKLSFSYFDARPVGWLMARLTSDSQRLSSILPWFLLDCVWGTTFIAGIVGCMLYLDVHLALIVLTVLPPLSIVSVIFQRKLLRSQRAVRKTNSRLTASFNEGIMGERTTKTLVREAENLEEFQQLSSEMYGHSLRNLLQTALYLPVVMALGSIGAGLALWRGGLEIGLDLSQVGGEGLTLGTLVAFMQYALQLHFPIQEMASRFTQMQAAQASAERIQELLDTEPAIQDSDDVKTRMASTPANSPTPDGGAARIERISFENVNFAYQEGETVLEDFTLEVAAGETIALVGATGSGKTTIVNLLARFYEPTAGRIRLNGVDYRERSLGWLQSNLGIVLQSPHLFGGTVRENIRYGRFEATDREVEEAARLVNADEFIAELDRGYDTEVGEAGNRLSMGQKQFVALARAVLADPQIFIMDEATSSVDTETERRIQDGIEKVLAGRISFIIAHRLSTIRSADRILVIDRGRLVEEGRHEELIARRGRYHLLYTRQFVREREAQLLHDSSAES